MLSSFQDDKVIWFELWGYKNEEINDFEKIVQTKNKIKNEEDEDVDVVMPPDPEKDK